MLAFSPALFADEGGNAPFSSYESEKSDGLVASVAEVLGLGASARGHVRDSPSGCEMRAHDPHGSHHSTGRVNGEIRSTCNNAVPVMYHTAKLQAQNWWGGWDNVGRTGVFNKANVKRGSAFGNDDCENKRYRVIGDGYIYDVDYEVYMARAGSRWIRNPCGM